MHMLHSIIGVVLTEGNLWAMLMDLISGFLGLLWEFCCGVIGMLLVTTVTLVYLYHYKPKKKR